jgi:lipopolysaccharide transport system permease protein
VISVIGVVTPDLTRIFNIFMGFLLYVTPVIYSNNVQDPFLKRVVELNPLTYLIGGARDLIISGKIENFNIYLLACLFSFILFLISWRLFFVSEDKVIERIY